MLPEPGHVCMAGLRLGRPIGGVVYCPQAVSREPPGTHIVEQAIERSRRLCIETGPSLLHKAWHELYVPQVGLWENYEFVQAANDLVAKASHDGSPARRD